MLLWEQVGMDAYSGSYAQHQYVAVVRQVIARLY